MNVAVTTLATDNLPYQRGIEKNREQYCSLHGYTLFFHKTPVNDKPPAWSKLEIILNIFEKQAFDWVLWVDSDAVIKNKEIKVEELIDNDFDLILSKDGYTYNSGVFLIRNTESSKKFLEECLAKEEFIGHPWEEQAAIVDFLENNKDLRVYALPQRLLNSYSEKPSLEGWYTQVSGKSYYWDKNRGDLGTYREGDFIIHFAGLTADEKALSIQEHLRQPSICVLSYATRVSSAGGNLAFYAEKIFKNNKAYAEKHGYDWRQYWGSLDESRPPAWSKLLYILKALEEGYDWVYWIDADAIIMNDSIPLTNFLDDRYDFIICKDAFSWNTGSWFIKNTEEAKDLLEYTYSKKEFTEVFLWEQGAFMNAAFEKGGRIKVCQQREFNAIAKETQQFFHEGNSYDCGVYKFVLDMKEYGKGVYRDGDFVLHFASLNDAGRNMLLEEYRPDLY